MYKPEINAFHHPTTTVFIDDNQEFLYSIALGVDRLPYRSFSDPATGLDYVNEFARVYFTKSAPPVTAPSLSALTNRMLAMCASKINNPHRFAEPSVLVVDYSMPQINGLELCSQIRNPNIKKVLLTGVADEKVAIEALNTETIDFYISKSETSLSHRLRNIIGHLENRYFQDLYSWPKDSGVNTDLPYLFDPSFADYFEDVCERLEIVEHYPLIEPPGFALVDHYGNVSRMLVCDEATVGRLQEQARAANLSATQLQAIRKHTALPYPAPAAGVNTQFYPATAIEGETNNYYCCVIENRLLQAEPHSRDSITTTYPSYNDFLQAPSLQFH